MKKTFLDSEVAPSKLCPKSTGACQRRMVEYCANRCQYRGGLLPLLHASVLITCNRILFPSSVDIIGSHEVVGVLVWPENGGRYGKTMKIL